MARHTALIRKSGPYIVESHVDGTLTVIPEWPQYEKGTPKEDGAHRVYLRLVLAEHIEELLNAPYEKREKEAE